MSRSLKLTSIRDAVDYIFRRESMLRDLDQHLRNAQALARVEAERAARERVEALQREMEAKARAHRQELSKEMEAMDNRHQAAMKRQADRYYQDLGKLRNWTQEEIDRIDVRVDEVEVDVADIKDKVSRLYEKGANEEKQAAQMLKDLQALSQAVEGRTEYKKYAAEKWDLLQSKIASLHSMHIPAASSIAQLIALTYELWDLERFCMAEKLKFEAKYAIIYAEAVELLNIMHQNRNDVGLRDKEGQILKDELGNPEKVELDFWTRGEYAELEKRMEDIKTELEKKEKLPELNEERLNVLSAALTQGREEQFRLVETALSRGLASEERVKLSEKLINAMEEQGFRLTIMENGMPANNYLGGEKPADQREGVFAILENPMTKVQMSIFVNTDEVHTGNQILIQRNDNAQANEEELRQNLAAIRRTFENAGCPMSQPANEGVVPDERQEVLADPEALLRAGIEEETKARVGLTINR